VLAVALALLAAVPIAPPRGFKQINPGSMGFNALPSLPTADPDIGVDIAFDVQVATQFDSSLENVAGVPYFKLTVPFARRVVLATWGTPLELWRVDAETQQDRGTPDRSGVSRGDLYFGGLFVLVPEGGWWPSIATHYAVKTTTGKSFNNRRFTDAPAYVIEAAFGKDVPIPDPPEWLTRLRVLGKFGFFSWQQLTETQNDAFTYGIAVAATFADTLDATLDWRGYRGGQGDAPDEPMLLGLELGLKGEVIDWVAVANFGFKHAPPFEVRLGFRVHFEANLLPWESGD